MAALSHFLLRARAWQLALVLYGPAIVAWIIAAPLAPEDSKYLRLAMPFAALWAYAIILIWMWVVVKALSGKHNRKIKGQRWFGIGLVLTVIAGTLIAVLVLCDAFECQFTTIEDEAGGFLQLIFGVLIIVGAVSSIYVVGYTAKRIVEAEMPTLTIWIIDYIGTMFAIWFFPIGVWFIQPKVRIMANIEARSERSSL